MTIGALTGADTLPWRTVSNLAVAVGKPFDLSRVLAMVVGGVRDLLDADRVTVLLTEQAPDRLVPITAVARERDGSLWQRFVAMNPIPLPAGSPGATLLAAGRVVVLDPSRAAPLVPPEWRAAFHLGTLVLGPMLLDGEVLGALAVEGPPENITADNLAAVQALAGLTAVAARTARGHEQLASTVRGVATLLEALDALAEATGLHHVTQTILNGLVALLGGHSCSVNLLPTPTTVRTLASRGDGQPEPGWNDLERMTSGVWGDLSARLAAEPTRWVVLDSAPPTDAGGWPAGGALLALPMAAHGRLRGFAVLGCDRIPDAEQLQTTLVYLRQAWLAIDRALREDEARQHVALVDALSAPLREPTAGADPRKSMEELASAVRRCVDADFIDVVFGDAESAGLVGERTPGGELAAILRNWRRQHDPMPRVHQGLLLIPAVAAGRVAGALRLRSHDPAALTGQEHALLRTVATVIAEVAHRRVQRTHLQVCEGALALGAERARLATELHVGVARELALSQDRLGAAPRAVQDPTLRRTLQEGLDHLGQAAGRMRTSLNGLAIFPTSSERAGAALRAFARSWQERTGTEVAYLPGEHLADLTAAQEGVFLRVLYDALIWLALPGRVSLVTVAHSVTVDHLVLRLQDDGTSLGHRARALPSLHPILRALSLRLEAAGGRLSVSDTDAGLSIIAEQPRRAIPSVVPRQVRRAGDGGRGVRP